MFINWLCLADTIYLQFCGTNSRVGTFTKTAALVSAEFEMRTFLLLKKLQREIPHMLQSNGIVLWPLGLTQIAGD